MTASKINYLAWSPGEHLARNRVAQCACLYHKTFNLKDNVVFHFEGHLWYQNDAVFYGWGDCRITSKHSLIQITHCESWLEGVMLSCQSGWNRDNKWMQNLTLKPQLAITDFSQELCRQKSCLLSTKKENKKHLQYLCLTTYLVIWHLIIIFTKGQHLC